MKLFLLKDYKNETLLFLGAFLVRALYAAGIQATAGSHGFISFSDAQIFFLQLATNLIHHGAFSLATGAPYFPDAYHTPLYPLFLAALLLLHFPLLAIALVQDVLAAVAVVLVYRIAVVITFSKKIALLASGISLLEPMSIYWNNMLMSDDLFAFLLVLSFYLIVTRRPYWCAAVLGLATLTRPIPPYFFPVFLLMMLYQEWSVSRSQQRVLKRLALTSLLFLAVLSPWYLRNHLVFNTWTFSSASWYQLYMIPLQDFAQAQHITVPPLPVHFSPGQAYERFNFEYGAFYKQTFLSIVSARPLQYAQFQLVSWATAFESNRYEYLVHDVLAVKLPHLFARVPPLAWNALLLLGEVAWMGIYLLAALAGLDKKIQPWWLFFAALALINLLLSGLASTNGLEMSRYELGFAPVYFMFAAAGARYVKNNMFRSR